MKAILEQYNIENAVELPSACISVIKENADDIELLVMGDCSIIFKQGNNIELLTTDEIRTLDNEKLEMMKKIFREKNIDIVDAYSLVLDAFREQRKLRNKKGGYYILDNDVEVIQYAKYKKINKDDLEGIILLSDGFSAYYECMELATNYEDFYNICMKENTEILYKQLRKRENDDNKLNKYPRFKVSDDASIIKILYKKD